MQLKPIFVILQAEIIFVAQFQKVVPWSWEGMPEFYGFSGHDDPHYPKDGVCEILRNNKDIEEVLTDEGEWEAFRTFIAEFKRAVIEMGDLHELASNNEKNPQRVGSQVYVR